MLARGFSVLRCFRTGEHELPLSEIARRADMPKATAHRIIAELVDEGMLERSEKGLRLGVALFMLGARVPRQLKFRDLAFPYAERLHQLTRGSAFIFISDAFGPDAALVDAVRRRFGPDGGLGAEGETWASAEAATRVLHAFAVREAEGKTTGEENRVRHQGFAAVRSKAGTLGVATPVLTASGTAMGALAVAGPHTRLEVGRAASHLRAACNAVSRGLHRTPELVPVQ
ncbi:IclR family transcriptional regulator [Streptomyces sp. NPDC001219]